MLLDILLKNILVGIAAQISEDISVHSRYLVDAESFEAGSDCTLYGVIRYSDLMADLPFPCHNQCPPFRFNAVNGLRKKLFIYELFMYELFDIEQIIHPIFLNVNKESKKRLYYLFHKYGTANCAFCTTKIYCEFVADYL